MKRRDYEREFALAVYLYKIAMAAGRDAGNRSARRAGRIFWNQTDWDCAADTVARLGADWFDYQSCDHHTNCERAANGYCARCHSEAVARSTL